MYRGRNSPDSGAKPPLLLVSSNSSGKFTVVSYTYINHLARGRSFALRLATWLETSLVGLAKVCLFFKVDD